MVALEPGEPLLLYVMATGEVVIMVLVTERPELQQPHVPKGDPIAGSRSQDPDPTEGSGDKEATGSHLPEPTPSPEPHIGFYLPEATSGPENQVAPGS
jgi:hypothetical protein